MRQGNRLLWLIFILCFSAAPVAAWARSAEDSAEKAVLVGRISHVDGQLLRYVPDEKDWVATVQDAPFGFDDALYADEDAKAEFIMPNNTWLRVGGNTQAQLITLEEDVTEIDVASGVGRFFNKSQRTVVKATTPFGYVAAPAGTVFDLYVGDESVEVIALKGTVDFVHDGDETRYEVNEGSTSIVADNREVTSGEGNVDADWDDWNAERNNVWTKRLEVKGDSVKYLPSQLHDESYALEENGRWERVHYQGSYHRFWRPARVSAGWAPFTAGRWTVWNGDNTWVPDEPFGYVTHHYGNWVHVNNFWYWSPPVVRVGVRVRGPVVGIGFGWYPGRVAWIHSGVDVGWVPLAPAEPYYSHRYWGPRSVVVANVGLPRININIGRFAYVNHAVVVNQNNFYSVNNYRNVRITNINRTTIINNYRAAPVVNNTVINNFNRNNQRFNFRNVNVTNKPHQAVLSRIQRNEGIARQARNVNARAINQNVSRARLGQPGKDRVVAAPKVTRKIVPANEVNKPRSEVRFQERALKQKARPVQERPDARRIPGLEGRRGGADLRPNQRGAGQADQMGPGGRRIRPPRTDTEMRPGATDQPGQPGEGRRVRPPRPGRDVQPAERDQPGQPGEGRRVRPPKPGRDLQPADRDRPGQPGERGRGRRPVGPEREIQRNEQGQSSQPRDFGPRRRDRVQPGTQDRLREPGEQRFDQRRGRPAREQREPGRMEAPQRPGQQQQMQREGRQFRGRRPADELGQTPRPRQQMQEQRGGRPAREFRGQGEARQPRLREQPAQRQQRQQRQQIQEPGGRRQPNVQRQQGEQRQQRQQGQQGERRRNQRQNGIE